MIETDGSFWDTPAGVITSLLIVCVLGGGLGALFAYATSLKGGG